MADNASRRGAVDLGVILMVLAFVVIGGFMYWLSGQAAAERSIEIVEDTTEAASTTSTSTARSITAADIQTDAGPLAGQEVRLAGQTVESNLGQQGVWIDLPTGPFLISFSDEMIADSTRIASGSMVTITGTVRVMNDSTSGAWLEAGHIGQGDQIAASFASYFIDATDIEVTGRAPAGN